MSLQRRIGISLSMMPPGVFSVRRIAFLWTLTPSTMAVPFLGSTLFTVPVLPAELPLVTMTVSFFLILAIAMIRTPYQTTSGAIERIFM